MEILFDIVLVLTPLLLLAALTLLIIFDSKSNFYFDTKSREYYKIYKLSRPLEIQSKMRNRIGFDADNDEIFITDEDFKNDFIKIKGYKND